MESPKEATSRQGRLRLHCRFRSAHAFTVEAGPVEAADATLPGGEH